MRTPNDLVWLPSISTLAISVYDEFTVRVVNSSGLINTIYTSTQLVTCLAGDISTNMLYACGGGPIRQIFTFPASGGAVSVAVGNGNFGSGTNGYPPLSVAIYSSGAATVDASGNLWFITYEPMLSVVGSFSVTPLLPVVDPFSTVDFTLDHSLPTSSIQWSSSTDDGVSYGAITGATSSLYSTNLLSTTDDLTLFQVSWSTFGAALSLKARLRVESTGTLASNLTLPVDIDIDSVGNYYVLDQTAACVRRYDNNYRFVSVVAGKCGTHQINSTGAESVGERERDRES